MNTSSRQPKTSAAMQRASGRQWALKPQDLAVALKLVALRDKCPPYAELAKLMRLSPYEAHAAIQRLIAAGLVADLPEGRRPVVAALREFVIFGARYAFPPVRGEVTIGVPTAHAAEPLKEQFAGVNNLPPVWPHPEGPARGQALLPLYHRLPEAVGEDERFYGLLSLFDALRAGQARERRLAAELLEERIS